MPPAPPGRRKRLALTGLSLGLCLLFAGLGVWQVARLVWKLADPEDLLAEARRHAEVLAAKPISSLVACKRVMVAPLREAIAAARERENQCFVDLMGGPANAEALAAFAEGRDPDFTNLPPGW